MKILLKRLIQVQREKQRGATAVEFAIVILIFITIIFGIIEFGLLMYNQHIATNAAREGARFGIVADRKTHVEIKDEVNRYGRQYIVSFGDPDFTVEVNAYNKDRTEKDENNKRCERFNEILDVTVTYNYDFLFLPFSRTITSTTTMRCE